MRPMVNTFNVHAVRDGSILVDNANDRWYVWRAMHDGCFFSKEDKSGEVYFLPWRSLKDLGKEVINEAPRTLNR